MEAARPVVMLVQPAGDDRDMYAEYLHHHGLTPVSIGDANAALRFASTADVIVTALTRLGAIDGFELIDRLKQDPEKKQIPIIVLTASPCSPERARQAGCDALLIKPCLPDRLLLEISRVLLPRAPDYPGDGAAIVVRRRRTSDHTNPDIATPHAASAT